MNHLMTWIALVLILPMQEPGRAPARLAVKEGDTLTYHRASTIDLKIEAHKGDAKEAGRHTVIMDLSYALKVKKAGDAIEFGVRFTAARLSQAMEGCLGAKKSEWELPKEGAVEAAMTCTPGGRITRLEPPLRDAFREAKCDGRLAKIPGVYFTSFASEEGQPDGPYAEGPVAPRIDSNMWLVTLTRAYGFTGLLDDFSIVNEQWQYMVKSLEAGVLTVGIELARVTLVKPFRDVEIELGDAKGSGTAKIEAATGVLVSAELKHSIPFSGTVEKRVVTGTLDRIEKTGRK